MAALDVLITGAILGAAYIGMSRVYAASKKDEVFVMPLYDPRFPPEPKPEYEAISERERAWEFLATEIF